jgi:site-specific recombinase
MTLLKILVERLDLAPVFQAVAIWIVYSSGFLAMQALGFTLATKIPSFAATSLAQWIRDARTRDDVKLFAAEVGLVVRSQFFGLLGNVLSVFAGAIVVQLALHEITALPALYQKETALKVVASLNPFGGAVLFLAALTGIELWASSICGGWFENFIVYRGVPEAIAGHTRLRKIFGADLARRYSERFLKNASGIATNVSLGFLFAFVPLFGTLWGLRLGSKHVTIETAGATFAYVSMRAKEIPIDAHAFWLAVIGLILVGVINFSVSFAMAMVIAIRAQNVRRSWVWHLVTSLWRRSSKQKKET